jgi:DNA-binding MarR family transcriptional regulator
MLDRRSQIEGILQCFQATKQKFLKGTHVLSNRKQIPSSQWMVLHIIYHNEGIGIKELSRILGTSSSAATQLVNNLVRKGTLVCEKNPEDRRALKIRLTKNTKELVESARSQTLEQVHSIFDALSDEELQQYCKLSKKITNHILEKQDR